MCVCRRLEVDGGAHSATKVRISLFGAERHTIAAVVDVRIA